MSFAYESLLARSNITGDVGYFNSLNVQDSATIANLKVSNLAASRPVFTDNVQSLKSEDMPNGSLIIGNAGSYSINTLSEGHNVDINNTAGNISVGVVDSPSFTDVTVTSLTPNSLVFADGDSKLSTSSSMTNGQLIIGSNTTGYALNTIQPGGNTIITNGDGAITVGVVDTPSFTDVYIPSLAAVGKIKPVVAYGNDSGKLITYTGIAGSLLIGSSSGSYLQGVLTAGPGVVIVNSDGGIEISADGAVPDINAGSNINITGSIPSITINVDDAPTFTNITDSGLTANSLISANGSKVLTSISTPISYLTNLTSDPQSQLNFHDGTIVTLIGNIATNTTNIGTNTTNIATNTTNIATNTTNIATNTTNIATHTTNIATITSDLITTISDGYTNTINIANVISGATPLADVTINSLTASKVIFSDASKKLISSTVPSSYINNFTSDPQTQITANADLIDDVIDGTQSHVNLFVTGTQQNDALIGTGNGVVIAFPTGTLSRLTLTDGQLMIGNSSTGTYTKATLTAGSNMAVTNGNGSISVALSDTPSVTSLTATSLINTYGINATTVNASNINTTDIGASGNVIANTLLANSLIQSPPIASVVTADSTGKFQNEILGNGNLLIGSGNSYAVGTITAAANMAVTTGAGSISVGTIDNPFFYDLGCNNVFSNYDVTAGNLASASNSVVSANSSGKLQKVSLGNGGLMIGNGSSYTAANITAGSNISVTNGAGSITISSPSVTLTAGDRISISGSHPNFTITALRPNYNQALITGSLTCWSSSFVATPYEVTITPQSTSSRIKVTINGNFRGVGDFAYLTIYRNYSVNLAASVNALASCEPLAFNLPVSLCVIDDPATTTAMTYTMFICTGSSGNANFNDLGCIVPVIAEEIFV